MTLLLDTCAFLWLTDHVEALPEGVRRELGLAENILVLHQASALEIQIQFDRGKLRLGLPPREFIAQVLERHDIEYRALDDATIWHLSKLPDLHRDPFDRLLVSYALLNGLPIVSPDAAIAAYPVRTLW